MLLGFGTGVYGVLIGAGGGFILGPVLLIFFGMEPKTVAGTALALVAVNSISGGITFRRMGLVDLRSGLLFAMAAIPGSVAAPFVLGSVGGNIFRLLFGILLVVLAFGLAVRQGLPEDVLSPKESVLPKTRGTTGAREITAGSGQVYIYQFNEALATAFNFVLGFISSFFGTGGGFLRTPVLVYVFSFPVRVAVATSIFTLSFYTTAGAITHAALGHVDWFPTFVMAGVGLVAGGQIGARLAGRLGGAWILRLLLIVVLALGVRLILEGVRG